MKNYNKLAFLNVLRIMLAIGIVLWHYSYGFDSYIEGNTANNIFAYLKQLTRYGGNQAFMLLAGMSFYIAYYKKLSSGELSMKDFAKKRAKRIYPFAILSVLSVYFLNVFLKVKYNADTDILLIHLLEDTLFFGSRLFGNAYGIFNGPIWFLSALLVAYLISCFIIAVTRKHQSIYWFLIPLIACFLIGNGSTTIVPILNLGSVGNELFNFFLGFWFMIFLYKFDNFNKYLKLVIRILGIIISFTYIIVYYKCFNKGVDCYFGINEVAGSIMVWIPLITALYGLKFNIIFDNKTFKFISSLSFYFYVWHAPIMSYVRSFNTYNNLGFEESGVKNFIIYFLIILIVSILSYLTNFGVSKLIKYIKNKKQTTNENNIETLETNN